MIIVICVLLLLAYVFDLTASKTKIPSVILLLLLGWASKEIAVFLDIRIPDLSGLLPAFGTVGLILIVLEGSLELEFNKSKFPLIRKSIVVALLPVLIIVFIWATVYYYLGDFSFKNCIVNVIPFCVISSSIAIPSAVNFDTTSKEFVIYESSLSDIIGVLLFNFFALNEVIDSTSFVHFGSQIILVFFVSFFATLILSFLLSKIVHPVKFAPIIVILILIYDVSKIYHLPALIFILFFGLFLGNLQELKRLKWIEKMKPEVLQNEVHKFIEVVKEGAFLVRASFFLLFGFLIETEELLNPTTILMAALIVISIFLIRWCILKIAKLPVSPLLFIAPRGLITILLFLSVPVEQSIPLLNKSLIIQVVILSALVMMVGSMFQSSEKLKEENKLNKIVE